MKFPSFLRLELREKGLRNRLLTIEALVFVLPALIVAYIFYTNNVFLKVAQIFIIALTLVLVLGGLMTLRQIFDKFLLFSDRLRMVEQSDEDLSGIHRESEELHEITVGLNRLMTKFEDTTAELRRRVYELFALKELTETASKTLNMEHLLNVLLEKALAVTRARIGSIFAVEPENNRLRVISAKGLTPGPRKDAYVEINKTLLRYVVSERRALIVEDIEKDPRTNRRNDPKYGPPSFMSVPVMIRKNLIAVMSLAHKETKEVFDSRDEQILDIMIGEMAFALENAQLHAALEEHARDLENQAKTLAGTNRLLEKEIAERREVEEALRLSKKEWEDTFDAMSDWITLTDREGLILRSNRTGMKILGDSAKVVTGEKCCALFHGLGEHVEGCPREKMLLTGQRETAELQGDGDGRWFTVTADPVKDAEGSIVGAVHIVRDITGRKKMEEDLLKTQKLESIGLLAGGIAHDFNNILTAIVGSIELAKMETGPQNNVYGLLERMEEASRRAKDLTHQFITFSKGGDPIKKIGPLGRILEETARLALAGSNAEAEFSLSPRLRPVEFDEAQIRQAFNNVVSNAIQSMPDGGIVKVRAENKDIGLEDGLPLTEGRYVEVTVEDQGVGIPQENLPMIFDPYFSTSEKGSRKGIGLGLTTAYFIIKRHGGYIHVTSEPEVGTMVSIYLPTSDKEEEKPPAPEEVPISGKGRVLLMDDEGLLREVSGQMLNCLGYDVELAEEGGEAITKYRQALASGEPFDAVVLDLTVPGGMGGRETAKVLREIDRDVVTIASSGYSDDPVMTDCRGHGFDGALVKPYEFEQLNEVLRNSMKREPR